MNSDNILLFENLMTAKEVGLKLGVHHKTVYEWAKLNRIPHVRLGRSIRFRPQELAEWLRKKGAYYGKKNAYP